jgi:NADPH:quinone reductase-like Zn-dependent oxidoreductase
MRRYHLEGKGIARLRLIDEAPPAPGAGQLLVALRANSLNQRDLMVVEGRLPIKAGVVPLSDGAGEVVAVGSGVTRFRVGDRVVGAFRQGWITGRIDPALRGAADLGGAIDGMLGAWALLDQQGLARIPDRLSFEEAACFPCAGSTAWSALMGRVAIRPGETVLVQGSGGVSLFALQIARLAGARVIATSSSAAKAERLRTMGAEAVIDYVADPDWHKAVLDLTDGVGVDHIVEVGGAASLARSMQCIRLQGHIAVVGLLGGMAGGLDPMAFISRAISLDGISVGSRVDLEEMMTAFAVAGVLPTIDTRFGFEDAPSAFAHLAAASHFGKVTIVH